MSEANVLRKLNVLTEGIRPILGMDNYPINQLTSLEMRSYDRIICRDALLLIDNPEWLMGVLHAICKNGGQLVIDVPFGTHDRAEEWKYKRKVFADTLRQFEPQWHFARRTFYLDAFFFQDSAVDEIQLGMAVANLRNVCKGMACELVAQWPVPADYKPTDPVSMFKMI